MSVCRMARRPQMLFPSSGPSCHPRRTCGTICDVSASRETNDEVARRLREVADLLEQQNASPFRVNAYRRAARTVESLEDDLRELVRHRGPRALEELRGIGPGIGSAIREMLTTGRWTRLEQLRGAADPVSLFRTIPGIGYDLAQRIYDHLGVETLEALEVAAHDGRLASVPGFGPRRLKAVRGALAAALGRRRAERRGMHLQRTQPDVATLLEIDAQYRTLAQQGKLPRVAPRRFNPTGEAWLPVMHVERHGWYFTALFSNTPRAHELGKTRDWVVIYFYDHDQVEGQCTVVTETSGPLRGQRVVRGREPECAALYSKEDGGRVPRADVPGQPSSARRH